MLDVYARLSRAYNGETIQVDDQVEVCLEELAERGADAGEVFKDNSLSAWKPNVVRKDWEALMGRLESGASDGVIVYDLTRFSRKIREGERLVELAAKGIRVWSLSGEYDLTTADGRRHFREANGFGMDPFPHRGLEPPAVEPGIRQQQQTSLVRNIAGFHMVDIDRRGYRPSRRPSWPVHPTSLPFRLVSLGSVSSVIAVALLYRWLVGFPSRPGVAFVAVVALRGCLDLRRT